MNPEGLAGPKAHILPEFEYQAVDCTCRRMYNNCLPEANAPISVVLGSWYVHVSGPYHETMENGFLCFVHLLQTKQWNVLVFFFGYLVNLILGFTLVHL